MMYPPCTLYVIRCQTPNKWYVGSTYRQKHKRFDEHRAGYGSKWTARHGFKGVHRSLTIPIHKKGEYENDLWMHYARLYGPENVRGGDVTICAKGTDAIPPWLLPQEFGGERIVDWGWRTCGPNFTG